MISKITKKRSLKTSVDDNSSVDDSSIVSGEKTGKEKAATKKVGTSGSLSSSTSANTATKNMSEKQSSASQAKHDKGLHPVEGADSGNEFSEQERHIHAQERSGNERIRAGTSGLLKTALVASLLALLIAAFAAYQITLDSGVANSQLAAMDERLKFAVLEQQNLQADFNRQRQQDQLELKRVGDALAEAQVLLGELQLAAQASVDDIKANLGDTVARWKLDEVHSLLTRVNRAYQLSGDQRQAIEGLMLVQASLEVINNPRLDAVKKALAEDILRVKADRNIDVPALHDQLAAIRAIVPGLVLAEDARSMRTSDASNIDRASNTDNAESGLLAASKAIFSDIGSLIKHKNLAAPLQPSLDSEARFVVFESFKLTIQGAMLALLQRDNPSYHTQLEIAIATLNAYFDIKQDNAKAIN